MRAAQLTGIRRAAFRDLSRLLELIGKPSWSTPVLIMLGLASSFAETIGITLILLFLYTATGHVQEEGGSLLSTGLAHAASWFGGTAHLAWLILLLIIARGALAMLYERISQNISEGLSERARNLVHIQYLTADYGLFQRREQANLLEILAAETWVIAGAYGSFTRLVINGCSILVFALFLLVISWKIMLVAIAGSVVISFVSRGLTRPAQALGHRVKESHENLSMQMLITVKGMRAIRAFGQESIHQSRFIAASREARLVSTARARLSAWIGPLTEVGYLAVLCIIIAGSAWWNTSFSITLGAVALLYRLQPHTREFETHLLNLAETQPQLRSVLTMIERGDKYYPPAGDVAFTTMREGVAFRDVSFCYKNNLTEALRGVSFDIPAGRTTAIIGASGAGKTTIVNLLLRLYEPGSGEITVDGNNLTTLRRNEWGQNIAAAGQDVDLIDGTVEDNIRMANALADDKEVRVAAESAGVSEFVEHLPDGFDTWIGQEGMRFSGGQRQRIGLARALLRNAQFMILDEAMSALDRGLEDRIKREIEKRLEGRTLLIITHRLETIKNADHAIWIEAGEIKAQGKPSEILIKATPVLAP